jgi:methylated-DNA-protein-cysteine methyltransferase-like protein
MPRDITFSENVYALVAQIPQGRVMTYGQIAAICGSPRSARIVGSIAHYGPDKIPWHRVVNKSGGMAGAFPGGRTEQAARLANEGVRVDAKYSVNLDSLIWSPNDLWLRDD